MKKFARSAATTLAMTAGLGLAGLGIATAANAEPAPFPDYHWCPGEAYDPGWGPNWDDGECHDDFHRDRDGFDHSRDFRGGYDDRGPGFDHGPDGRGPGFDDHGPDGRGPGYDDHGRGR
ncbi:MAG: pilin [Mycobacterium sp.]